MGLCLVNVCHCSTSSCIAASINIGLNLFADKYASRPEQGLAAFGVVIAYLIIYTITDIAFAIYNKVATKYREEWVTPGEGKGDKKKSPSQVS